MTEKEEILTLWTDTEKEDALVATYDEAFGKLMLNEGAEHVKKVLTNSKYKEAIEEINLEGGFVN